LTELRQLYGSAASRNQLKFQVFPESGTAAVRNGMPDRVNSVRVNKQSHPEK
jgi:hypothetical protein